MWIQNKIKKGSMCYRISIKLKCINESLFLPALATQLLLASAAIEMLVSAFTSVFVVLDAFGGRSIHHIGAWPRRGTIWHWRSGHIFSSFRCLVQVSQVAVLRVPASNMKLWRQQIWIRDRNIKHLSEFGYHNFLWYITILSTAWGDDLCHETQN